MHASVRTIILALGLVTWFLSRESHAAPQTLVLLDTLTGSGNGSAIQAQSMTDLVKTLEVAVALPAIPAGMQCSGPVYITPSWCADYTNVTANLRVFQLLLYGGDSTGPVATKLLANTRFNMTLLNASFPRIPACPATSGAGIVFTLPLFTSTGYLRANTSLADQYYWLIAYAVAPLNLNATTRAATRLRWSIATPPSVPSNHTPESVFRDRNNYYGHGWTTWTSVRRWEEVYTSAGAVNASASRVRARVSVGGCQVVPGTSSPLVSPVASPLALPSPSPRTISPLPSPLASPSPSPSPLPSPLPTSPTTSPVTNATPDATPTFVGIDSPWPESSPVNSNVTTETPSPTAATAISTGSLVGIIVASIAGFFPLLVGCYFLVRWARRRVRFANNKLSFRESVALHADTDDQGGARGSGGGGNLYYIQGRGRASGSDESEMVNLSGSGTWSRPPPLASAPVSPAASPATGSKRRAKQLGSSPSGAWISADAVMFDVPLADAAAAATGSGSGAGRVPPPLRRSNSGSVFISAEEDSESRSGTGTPRHVVQLADDGDDDGDDNDDSNNTT